MSRKNSPVDLAVPAIVGLALGLWVTVPLRADPEFVRGNVDITDGVSIDDAFWIIAYLFRSNLEELPCDDAADVDDSGEVELTDAIYLLNHLFRGGPPPPGPYPFCGSDPTDDPLRCGAYGECPLPLEVAGIPLYYDGLIFVVDRSQSMAEHFELAKGEVLRVLGRLRKPRRFGIIFVSADMQWYPELGPTAVASPPEREAARAFVTSMPLGGSTCHQQGLARALGMIWRTPPLYADPRIPSSRIWVIVYISDGDGHCQGADEVTYWRQTIETITTRNDGDAVIHAVAVGEPNETRAGFLRELAERNGGEYATLAPE